MMIGLKSILGGLLLAGALCAQAYEADCEAPRSAPGIPDGTVAPEADMAEAGVEVREYVAETQDYLACLEADERRLGKEITDEQRASIIKSYNAAVEEMQGVAENFNEQVRLFRENAGN